MPERERGGRVEGGGFEAVIRIRVAGVKRTLARAGGPVIRCICEFAGDFCGAGGVEVEGAIGHVESPDVGTGRGVALGAEVRGDCVLEFEGVEELGVVHPVAAADDGAGGDPLRGFPAATFPAGGAVFGEGEEAEVAAFDDGEDVAGPLPGACACTVRAEDVLVLDEAFFGPRGSFEFERFIVAVKRG